MPNSFKINHVKISYGDFSSGKLLNDDVIH